MGFSLAKRHEAQGTRMATDADHPLQLTDGTPDQRRRARMVRDQLADLAQPRVVEAMALLPRHAFVPAELRAGAYDDTPRLIGAGQTISQPRLVARMLALLSIHPGDRILDVGAGSGYAATLLAMLAGPTGSVLAVERQASLVPAAQQRAAWATAHLATSAMPVGPLTIQHGDALAAEHGTFNHIHMACVAPERPTALAARLAPGGSMVVPIQAGSDQHLWLAQRQGDHIEWTQLEAVVFVPALRGVVGTL